MDMATHIPNAAVAGEVLECANAFDAEMQRMRKELELIRGGAENFPGGWSGTIAACERALSSNEN